MTVLLVDVANTVGSRPDGWWRDRARATTGLLDRLALLVGTEQAGPDGIPVPVGALVAVVEGRARDVDAPSGVRLVRAAGSGDDALAAGGRGRRRRAPTGHPRRGTRPRAGTGCRLRP